MDIEKRRRSARAFLRAKAYKDPIPDAVADDVTKTVRRIFWRRGLIVLVYFVVAYLIYYEVGCGKYLH